MTPEQAAELTQASEVILKALRGNGLPNARLRQRVTRALTAFHHDRGDVNIDFNIDIDAQGKSDRVVKVCMYVYPDGIIEEIQSELVSVGKKYKGWVIEFGRQGNQRKSEGVLYKLNTGVALSKLTSSNIANIAKTVKDFVGDVSQVLNK